LRKEAVRLDLTKKMAFDSFAKRTHARFKDSEYGVCDISSLTFSKGTRVHYKEILKKAELNTHYVGGIRPKF
jgi:hypothetical protein